MKVIATTVNGVLCEVSKEELAYLNGYNSILERGFDLTTHMAVGTEINIKRMVETAKFIKTLQPELLVKMENVLCKMLGDVQQAKKIVSEHNIQVDNKS